MRSTALLEWYAEVRRPLPWRRSTEPWPVLVSEVMLQQTQVDRAIPAFTRFLELFPTPTDLARSDLDTVLAAWQGLGYPVRARRLRQAARMITEAGWPTTVPGLIALPGVGPYTAAAVASIAFGEDVAVVDTNVRRVVSRWRGAALDGRELSAAATEELTGPAGTWNQAVMELGALVCRPRPDCSRCPVTDHCADPSIYVAPPRQPRYEGSIRQVRGDILRALAACAEPTPVSHLEAVTGHDPDDVIRSVAGLARDGLVVLDGETVTLAP